MADNQSSTSYTGRRVGDQLAQEGRQIGDAVANSTVLIEPLFIMQASMLRAWSEGLEAIAHSFAERRNNNQNWQQGNR